MEKNFECEFGKLVWLRQRGSIGGLSKLRADLLEPGSPNSSGVAFRNPLPIFPLDLDEVRNGVPELETDGTYGFSRGLVDPEMMEKILDEKTDAVAVWQFPSRVFENQLIPREGDWPPAGDPSFLEAMRYHRVVTMAEEKGTMHPEIRIDTIDERGFVVHSKQETIENLWQELSDIIDDAMERIVRQDPQVGPSPPTADFAAYVQSLFVSAGLRRFHAEIGLQKPTMNLADVVMANPEFRARSRAII